MCHIISFNWNIVAVPYVEKTNIYAWVREWGGIAVSRTMMKLHKKINMDKASHEWEDEYIYGCSLHKFSVLVLILFTIPIIKYQSQTRKFINDGILYRIIYKPLHSYGTWFESQSFWGKCKCVTSSFEHIKPVRSIECSIIQIN